MPPELTNDVDEDVALDMDDTLLDDTLLDDAGATKVAEKPAIAESSTAEDANKTVGKDALSLVRDVVDARTETTAASSAKSEETGDLAGDKTPKAPDNEEFSDVPFHKHPRFQELKNERNAFKVDAERYRNVDTFIRTVGLDGGEAKDILEIGGLIKTNPAEAWRRMKPVVEQVLAAAGEVLPADLKTMVDAGHLTREGALEVSRSRAQVNSVELRQKHDQTLAEQHRIESARNATMDAVNGWEADRRTRDPNFDAKLPLIEKEVAWLQVKEGRPNTPQGVQAQLQKAYDAVAAAYVPPVQTVPAQRPTLRPITGGQSTAPALSKPRTSLEIIQNVVARRA